MHSVAVGFTALFEHESLRGHIVLANRLSLVVGAAEILSNSSQNRFSRRF